MLLTITDYRVFGSTRVMSVCTKTAWCTYFSDINKKNLTLTSCFQLEVLFHFPVANIKDPTLGVYALRISYNKTPYHVERISRRRDPDDKNYILYRLLFTVVAGAYGKEKLNRTEESQWRNKVVIINIYRTGCIIRYGNLATFRRRVRYRWYIIIIFYYCVWVCFFFSTVFR